MKRVLFVCVENSNRSQVAEAFARRLGGPDVEAWSAGSRPSGTINPKAIRFMDELGMDLRRQSSKSLGAVDGKEFDAVVTMGCGDACPLFPGTRYEDWELDDPAGQDVDAVRPIRDDIERRVRQLLSSLGVPSA
jgi:arsenate reductase